MPSSHCHSCYSSSLPMQDTCIVHIIYNISLADSDSDPTVISDSEELNTQSSTFNVMDVLLQKSPNKCIHSKN